MAKRTTATGKSPITKKTGATGTSATSTSMTQGIGESYGKTVQEPSPETLAATTITQEMIAHRAYEIWKSQGGSDMENWLRAERELRDR